jgi:hypothetical protein
MNLNTPLPTAEELAKLQRDSLRQTEPEYTAWDDFRPADRSRWVFAMQSAMQSVLDHLKPWLKEPQPPDWLKNPLKAMECAECPTFLNSVAQIKELESEAANHSGELASVKMTAMYAERHQAELQAKIETIEKRVAELEWRPVSVKPMPEDADPGGRVVVTDGHDQWGECVDYPHNWSKSTHWRPAALPKQPTPDDRRREVFEKAFAGSYDFLKDFSGEYVSAETRQAWIIWQRAIVETENKTRP